MATTEADKKLAAEIVGIATVERPSDNELQLAARVAGAISNQRETDANKCEANAVKVCKDVSELAYNHACTDCAAAIRGK